MRAIPTRYGAAEIGSVFAVSTRAHSHAPAHTPHNYEISLLSNCGPRERETARFQRRRVRARWLSARIRSCFLNPNLSSLFAGCLLCGPHLQQSPPRTPPGPCMRRRRSRRNALVGCRRQGSSFDQRRCTVSTSLPNTSKSSLRTTPCFVRNCRRRCAALLLDPYVHPTTHHLSTSFCSPSVNYRPCLLRTRNALGTFILE